MKIIWFDGSEMVCNEIVIEADGSLTVDGYRWIDHLEVARIVAI